jgi:hypothetical protein
MGNPRNKALRRFPQTADLASFGITANRTAVAGTFSLIGSYTVGAQQEATWGVSTLRAGGIQGEPVYLRFDNESGVQLNGRVRFVLSNAQGTSREVVYEERTERLVASQNDRNSAPLLTEYMRNAGEDSLLLIEFKVDGSSNATVDYDGTNTKVLLPITVYQ